jgi:RHS repeat-associated protein
MTSNGSAAYTYNQENQMTGTAGVTYLFDGDGQRVKKASPASLYWYGATENVLDETSSNGTLVSEYVFFNGKRVARRDADNTVKYYFADNLGSASVITNATGAMPPLEESDYYPYGGEIAITNGDSNHYKFTGKERDTESGLDNFGARFFTSNLGRFMTPDWAARPTAVPYAVFGDPQSLNLYTYVENAPVNRVDADGHYCVMAGLGFWCSNDPMPGDKDAQQTNKSNPPNQSAQNQSQQYNASKSGPEDPTNPGKPLSQNPVVKKASDEAFMKTTNGTARGGLAEAGFAIENKDGTISIDHKVDSVNSDKKANELSITKDENTIAILHTHGNSAKATPSLPEGKSPGDVASPVPNFVRSKSALYVTVPGTTNYIQLVPTP